MSLAYSDSAQSARSASLATAAESRLTPSDGWTDVPTWRGIGPASRMSNERRYLGVGDKRTHRAGDRRDKSVQRAVAAGRQLWRCTMAALESGASGWFAELAAFGIRIAVASLGQRSDRRAGRRDPQRYHRRAHPLDALVLEGAVLRGPAARGASTCCPAPAARCCTGSSVSRRARRLVVAVGSCAAFGGVPMAGHNPTDASGLHSRAWNQAACWAALSLRAGLPVINIAGCAPHPDWIAERWRRWRSAI